MKKEGTSNKKRLLVVILAAVLLVLVAAVLIIGILGRTPSEDPSVAPAETVDVYWNVHRNVYMDAEATSLEGTNRKRDENGYYNVVFAHNGEQVTYLVGDEELVKKIDSMDVMGLNVDDEGVITDACSVEELGGKLLAPYYYVAEIMDAEVVVDSSSLYNGVKEFLTIDDTTALYDVSGISGYEGVAIDRLSGGDRIVAVCNGFDKVICIFVVARQADLDVYYNVEQMWDSTLSSTSRVPNKDGEYEYVFLYNEELITLKTKSKEVASSIDKLIPSYMLLSFDSAGYITGAIWAPHGIGGLSAEFAGWYDVTQISGNNVTAEKFLQSWDTGTIAKGTIATNCKVYDISDSAEVYGKATDLRVGDRIIGMTNASGQVCLIYVIRREVDSEIYWNVDRQYDYNTGSSARKPDKDGYYSFRLAVNGQQITVKTKDKDIVNRIDCDANCLFGLKLNGDEIEKVYSIDTVTGGWVVADGCEVTRKVGDILMVKNMMQEGAKEQTFNMNAECEVYNVTTTDENCGKATTLKVGDRIRGLTNPKGELIAVYVLIEPSHLADNHYCEHCKKEVEWIGWDGVSYFEKSGHYYLMRDALNVSQNTVGTPDKTDIDVVLCLNGYTLSSRERAFLVRGNLTIVDHKNAGGMIEGRGHSKDGNAGVFLIGSGGKVNLYSGTVKLAEDQHYVSHGGVFEVAKGCQLHIYGGTVIGGEADTGGAVQLWGGVMTMSGGTITGGSAVYGGNVYVEKGSVFTMSGGTIQKGTAKEGGNVLVGLQADFRFKGGAIKKGRALRKDLNASTGAFDGGHGGNVMSSGNFCMDGGTISEGYANGVGGGNVSLSGDSALLTMNAGAIIDGQAVEQGGGGNVLLFNKASKFIMNGGTVTGGYAGKVRHGGNILVDTPSTMTINGGTISNGETAGSGGNIFVFGTLQMNGGEIFGGTSSAGEENILLYISKDKEKQFAMNGGTVKGSVVVANFTDTEKTISLSGTSQIIGSETDKNLVLPEKVKLDLIGGLKQGAQIGVTASGVFTTKTPESNIVYFKSDVPGADVCWTEEGLAIGAVHCICGGALEGTQGHTCKDLVWQIWTSDTELPTEAGNYMLSKDVKLQWQHRMEKNINLCLNGHTITRTDGDRIMTVSGGAVVCVCDCSEGQAGSIHASETDNDEQGVCVWIHEKSVLNLYSGSVDASKVTTTNAGAAVCVDYGEGNTFNMYGGTVIGGKAASGAAIAAMDNSVLNLYGGSVKGGTAKNGGAVFSSGEFTMSGGAIDGGTANYGGCLYLGGSAAYTITGGTITGGTANNNGGNIFTAQSQSVLQISDAVISYGKATGNGGNICGYGPLTIGGNTQILNDADHKTTGGGGNIFGGSTVTLQDNAFVSGGHSIDAGGNILMDYDQLLTIQDSAQILGGNSEDSGGNIRGSILMSGGKVSGGTAALNGYSANVHIHDRRLTMSGGVIEGACWISGEASVTLSGTASITGGGSNLRLNDNVKITVEDGFTGNVGVSLDSGSGIFTTENASVYKDCFTSDEGYDISVTDKGELMLGRYQCVCGAKSGSTNHTCAAPDYRTYLPWEQTTDLPTEGNYYLVNNVVLEWQKTIDGDLSLDLNGKTLTRDGNGEYRVLVPENGGALSICDSSSANTGRIYSTGTSIGEQGVCVYVRNGGIFKLYSGTVDASATSTSNDGAAICVNYGAENRFYMYGGTVVGGTAGRGGAIAVMDNAQADLLGGSVVGGTSAQGSVFTTATGKLTLGGSISVSGGTDGRGNLCNLYLPAGAKITIRDDFAGGVGITVEDRSTSFADEVPADAENKLISDLSAYAVVRKEDSLYLQEDEDDSDDGMENGGAGDGGSTEF